MCSVCIRDEMRIWRTHDQVRGRSDEATKSDIDVAAGEENVGKVKGLGTGIWEDASVQVVDPLVWVS